MEKLHIFADIEGNTFKVGRLAMDEQGLHFQHDESVLESGLNLSPFHLDPGQGALVTNPGSLIHYNFLPGVFVDSLADGWGYQVRSGALKNQGVDHDNLSIIKRLAYLGDRAMGALCYEPEESLVNGDIKNNLNLRQLASASLQLSQGNVEAITPELAIVGGSFGGKSPKVAVGLNVANGKCVPGVGNIPNDFEHYLVKFRQGKESISQGAGEYVYSLMAKESGIDIPDTRLLEMGSERFFAIKRFDRIEQQKLHVHSFGHLLNATPKHRVSYEMLFGTTQRLTNNMSAVAEVFRRMSFNVAVHNRDDHPNNHAFLMNAKGEWSLAPAYDLTYSQGLGKYHQMEINGKTSVSKEALSAIGIKYGLSKAKSKKILDQVAEGVAEWPRLAKRYELNKEMVINVNKSIDAYHGKGLEIP